MTADQEQTECGASTVFKEMFACRSMNECYEIQRKQFERGQESMRTDLERVTADLAESRATEAELRRQRDGYFAALNSIAASYCESGRATYHSHIAKAALDAAEQPARAEGGQG